MIDITREGESEPFKGAVHFILGALAATCALYNMACISGRRHDQCDAADSRLFCNAIVYGLIATYEGVQVARHWRR